MNPEVLDQAGRKPFELEAPRSEEEVALLRRKIVTIARIFSSNSQMKVFPTATDNEPWACSVGPEANQYYREFMEGKRETLIDVPTDVFKPRVIYYNRGSLQNHTLEEVLGVLRHELGHANHTDFRLMLEGQKFASTQGYPPLSWLNLMNALEDTWVNNREIKKSETVREQMEHRYSARTEDLEEHTPKLPINLQLGKNILYYWITGKSMSSITDQRVLEAFEKIRSYVDEFASGVSAEENFQLVKEKIWPVYKELEEQAQTDAQNQEMIDRLLGQNQQQPGQGQPGEQQQESGGQPGGLLQKLQQMLRGESGQKPQEQTQQQTGQQSNQLQQLTPESLQESLKQQAGQSAGPLEQSELSEGLKGELEEVFNNLPEEVKEQISEAAKRSMEEQSIEELKEEQHMNFLKFERNKQTGRMELQMNIPSTQEIQKIEAEMGEMEQEEQQAEQAERQEKIMAEQQRERQLREEQERQREIREMKRDGFEENQIEAFRLFRSYERAVKKFVTNFIDRILPVLPKKEETYFEGLNVLGKRLDTNALAKKIPIDDLRVMNRKEIRSTEEARLYVELLIDNSGSMGGVKMQESIKTAIFFARVLRALDVPFAIKLFGDQVLSLKGFDEDYDETKFKIKPKLVFETDARGGSTDIGSPLVQAHEEMVKAKRKFSDSQGLIFLITDGQANSGLTGEDLSQRAQEIGKLFPIFVFGLAQGQDPALKQYLEQTFGAGRVVMPERFEELPNQAQRVLFTQLHRLLRRLQS